jgi:hypothetical protein
MKYSIASNSLPLCEHIEEDAADAKKRGCSSLLITVFAL